MDFVSRKGLGGSAEGRSTRPGGSRWDPPPWMDEPEDEPEDDGWLDAWKKAVGNRTAGGRKGPGAGRRSPEESRPAWMDEEEDRGRRIRGREDPLEDPEWVDFVANRTRKSPRRRGPGAGRREAEEYAVGEPPEDPEDRKDNLERRREAYAREGASTSPRPRKDSPSYPPDDTLERRKQEYAKEGAATSPRPRKDPPREDPPREEGPPRSSADRRREYERERPSDAGPAPEDMGDVDSEFAKFMSRRADPPAGSSGDAGSTDGATIESLKRGSTRGRTGAARREEFAPRATPEAPPANEQVAAQGAPRRRGCRGLRARRRAPGGAQAPRRRLGRPRR